MSHEALYQPTDTAMIGPLRPDTGHEQCTRRVPSWNGVLSMNPPECL